MSDRFMIFALARTGSTSLMRILETHPDVTCLFEPFNLGAQDQRESSEAKDARWLESVLERIWSRYDGFKHIWDPVNAYPFYDGGALNRHLVSSAAGKVVFLQRRNSLRRIVSLQVAGQTDVWDLASDTEREAFRQFPLQPLDEDWLRAGLQADREIVPHYARLLEESGRPHLRLWYEDLFADDVPAARRLQAVNDIFTFLGVPPVAADDAAKMTQMNWLFDPGLFRANSEESYARIPGIESIEERFGSDEGGWLFR